MSDTAFDTWWYETGSGFRPGIEDDYESHAKRVARLAWVTGAEWGIEQAIKTLEDKVNE